MYYFIKDFLILLFLTLIVFSTAKANTSHVVSLECTYNRNNINIGLSTGVLKTELNAKRFSNDLSYNYYIDDINSLNEVNDWVEIKDNEGHKIIFSLKCKKTY